ncbi:adenylosuccinate lyase [Candidatus Peregrinibacteria bacterium]|nr:adenylosuccinate lyase [Candidatus Peregrinibacteria bacterium]
MRDPLVNISPLDGRYGNKVEEIRLFLTELSLIKFRVLTEIEWFIYISNKLKLKGAKVWKPTELKELRNIYMALDLEEGNRIKEIEKETNHDVKAVEYYIKQKFKNTKFEKYGEFVHFACTSEDINNISYSLMIKGAVEQVLNPVMVSLTEMVYKLGLANKNVAMMSRTHGQTASPTTMGKELINVVARLEAQLSQIFNVKMKGKINGAVGNFNAHSVAYPKIDWSQASKNFVQGLGLEHNAYTTQIEPHDYNAELFDAIKRFNTVLIDFNRDVWSYISLGYFKQKTKKGEVGSSTMPHKVNPIDFENSEGNLGLANALLSFLSEKLPISRWQRDLTDSTVQRNIGVALGYCLLAYKNCAAGLMKLERNDKRINKDIDGAWELLAEPIQTIMRKHKIEGAYEKLKNLTRGKVINKQKIAKFIDKLKIPADEKKRLKNLTPSKYIGLASQLVDDYEPKMF